MCGTEQDVVGMMGLAKRIMSGPSRLFDAWLRFGLFIATASFFGVACSSSAPDSSPSRSATTPAVPSSTEYHGRGFALTLPKGWSATEPLKPKWPAGVRPDDDVAGFTVFVPPDSAGFLAVGSRPVAPDSTAASWQRQMQAANELN